MDMIGRKIEQETLKRLIESDKSEFVVVFGRRRVGKTFLIREFFNQWSQTSSSIFKCQIPSYITKAIWMIYTLPCHIYSLTQNPYTVDKTK